MPTPEAHAQSALEMLLQLGGSAAGGALLLEMARYILGRRKHDAEANKTDAEAHKISVEALTLLHEAVQKQAAEIMAADKVRIEKLEARVDQMQREHRETVDRIQRQHEHEISGLWAHVTILRNKLIEAKLPVPLPPSPETRRACETKDEREGGS